jgi:hypothetical protein
MEPLSQVLSLLLLLLLGRGSRVWNLLAQVSQCHAVSMSEGPTMCPCCGVADRFLGED